MARILSSYLIRPLIWILGSYLWSCIIRLDLSWRIHRWFWNLCWIYILHSYTRWILYIGWHKWYTFWNCCWDLILWFLILFICFNCPFNIFVKVILGKRWFEFILTLRFLFARWFLPSKWWFEIPYFRCFSWDSGNRWI